VKGGPYLRKTTKFLFTILQKCKYIFLHRVLVHLLCATTTPSTDCERASSTGAHARRVRMVK
jgi:hypothetical protein